MDIHKSLGRHRACVEICCYELVTVVTNSNITIFQLTDHTSTFGTRGVTVLAGPFSVPSRTTSIVSCCFGWHFVYWYIITEDNFIMFLKYSSV